MGCSLLNHLVICYNVYILKDPKNSNCSSAQVQHGMGPLINMKKLASWDNYELYGCKILHIETISTIESENLDRIGKFFV